MLNIKKYFIIGVIPLLIFGCNSGSGDGDGDKPLPAKEIAINAQDSLSFSPTKNTQIIDLRQKVTAEDNQNLIIEDIDSIDNNCSFSKSDINGLTFKVTTNGANVCRFKYHVKPSSSKYKGTSEAIVQVVVTDDYTKGDYLPPVSRTITESGLLTLDDRDLLIKDGFELDPNSIYLTGETGTSEIGTIIHKDTSSISYQAPDNTTGTVRIFYTEIDSLNNIARPGVIYIAIGQKNNHSPVAMNDILEPINLITKNRTIDISSYIRDQDESDSLQLIDVKPLFGTVKIDSEHSFIYTAQASGKEVLTYIISDHNGGYGIGTLSISVTPYETIVDETQKRSFSPPLTMNQLSETQGAFTDQFMETGITGITGLYPTFSQKLADAYCITHGMDLASLDMLQKMRTNVLADQPVYLSKYLWHSGKSFLTSDGDAISLDTGDVSSISDGYFSCTDTIIPRTWEFLSPYYGTQYGQPVTVLLSTETEAGKTIFLTKDKYNLNYTVDSINVDGELIDPTRADEYITVEIVGNKILVNKVDRETDFAANTTLTITDPVAGTSATKIMIGIALCPSYVTKPPIADMLGCLIAIKGKDNELFTAPISNNMLETMAISSESISKLGNNIIGSGTTFFQAITWSSAKITTEDRRNWIETVQNSCDIMNTLKVAGRENWQSSSTNIDDLKPTETDKVLFTSPESEHDILRDYPIWLSKVDHAASYGAYGLGYVNSDPNSIYYLNQDSNTTVFSVQGNKSWYGNTNTFPSCWSKN